MTTDQGAQLYTKVEQALQDFQKGVARLKAQQEDTDALLADGKAALENLAFQVAQSAVIQKAVEDSLRCLEEYRCAQLEENAGFQDQVKAEFTQQKKALGIALENLKAAMGRLGKEMLERTHGLGESLAAQENRAKAHRKELWAKVQLLEDWARRQKKLESRLNLLLWGWAALLALFLAYILF